MFHPLDHNTLASTVDGGHSETSRLLLSDAVFRRMLSLKENDQIGLCQSLLGWFLLVSTKYKPVSSPNHRVEIFSTHP